MSQKAFIFFLFLLLSVPRFLYAEASSHSAKQPEFSELFLQGGELAQRGEWDRSERVFLKASESPAAEERVQVYEQLTALYTRLRLPKKAAKTKKRAEDEKKFIAKRVPADESYYETYTLQEGDTYAKIARRQKISLEWLKRANLEKPLVTGKTIRVPKLPFYLIVNRNLKTLEWRRGKEVLKTYPIAVGKKESETPAGEFEIISRVKHPVWYHLNLEIPPESPQNLLGTRWLGLNVKSYGIHGTRNPRSINYAVSHGCVRMHNRDVEELFDWIPIGTKVTIRDSN